ncbi:very long chain fatty acid elongase AAEL008004-like [Diabrotica undecimpunctata]|uniref:very long chain fatty acid elongase AAEL008004-like n=1 Tax=Diabrotica undecimpunctata TaxID=50387 RepID=UPI003B64084E
MALLFRTGKQLWQYFEELSDPANVSFITSPIFIASFLITYVLLVTKVVPSFMENRRPYNIRRIIIVYDIIQILVNLYLFIKALIFYAHSPYLICVESTMEHLLALGRWEIFFLKAFDCVETVFFVLKKNYRQVSFLHVYHHSGMVFLTWVSVKFDLGPLVIFIPTLNCFVHAVMFTYYLLTSIDPKWKKRTDLKKKLTQLQLVQFFLFVCHALSTMVVPGCYNPSPFGTMIWVTQNVFMTLLFGDFYIKTYWRKKSA